MRQSNVPGAPGAFLTGSKSLVRIWKGATITIHRPLGYPVIILDDITTGRLVSSVEVHLEPGVYAPIFGDLEVDGRGVLLDAQFRYPSNVHVNGCEWRCYRPLSGEYAYGRLCRNTSHHGRRTVYIGYSLAFAMIFG